MAGVIDHSSFYEMGGVWHTTQRANIMIGIQYINWLIFALMLPVISYTDGASYTVEKRVNARGGGKGGGS